MAASVSVAATRRAPVQAGAQGMRVIGFEPVKSNWLLASQSAFLNGIQDRARIYHAAVGATRVLLGCY